MTNDPVLLNDWHPVTTVEELNDNPIIGARLLEEDIVVWRAGEQVHAWQDKCIHRGTRLSLGKITADSCIQCPYHGWVYDGKGQCVKIPAMPEHSPGARTRIQTFQVREEYDLIWVCLGEPANDIAPFPEWDKSEFRKILCGPHFVQTSGPRIIENFLDVSHFPYVHEDILGTQENTEIVDYDVKTDESGVVASNVKVYQPDPYGTGEGDTVVYTYKTPRPLTAYLLKESEGPQFSILLMNHPPQPSRKHRLDVDDHELRP